MEEHGVLFIDGNWRSPAGSTQIQVTSPVTEKVIGAVPQACHADVDAAVNAARAAFEDPAGWSALPAVQRARALERLADELGKRTTDTVRAVSTQNGMPVTLGKRSEAIMPAALLRYYAELIRDHPMEQERTSLTGGSTFVRQEPIGVVAAIVPWNYPQTLAFFKLAPALAAGCPVVLKPAPETVFDAYVLAEAAIAAGLPPGTLAILPGGRETGAALVAHPGVDKVAFTGSTTAGRAIAEECGRLLRPVSLELGGKSAAVVLDDADLRTQTARLFGACLANNGQTCYLSTRILAPRARYTEVVDTLADLARSLVVGDPLDPATQIGPLVTRAQRERIEAEIGSAIENGARLVAGGSRPPGFDRGWFLEPTVFADVDNSSALARRELFGPVLAVTPYSDTDEAIRIANDSPYGLGGTVWSADVDRAKDIAARMHTGSVGINGYQIDLASPFGGVKDSGLGRELGPEGLASYQSAKSVYLG
ncbi:aldehyde dehydrogenase [Sciscionella marina]|uniref:aldehyde dehydrogenase n=1 Tax=Sciscionella marina TaxID=508770 RepID=UPI00035F731F|nr:aldehyde dehydrogenase [Sciscionella marina]